MILKTDLLPYQQEAYEKLHNLRIGALYMEMGTGKTRTALELIKHRIDQGKVNHVIWLCPCSIKDDIAVNILEHSDLKCGDMLTICGIETLSTSIRMISELLYIAEHRKAYLVVDESSKIKNHQALRSKHIKQIAAHCPYRLILNGTPISKNETDLFSQWQLLDWRILGYRSFWSFAANHIEYDSHIPDKIVRTRNTDYLARKIEPYTYQITKKEALKLPEKNNRVRYFSLTDEQYEHYNWVSDKLLMELDEMKPETIYRLLNALQAVISGYALSIDKDLKTYRYPFFINNMDNPRLQTLLDEVKGYDNEKLLIFCNYVDEIKMITKILPNAVSLYGETPQRRRQEVIEAFRNDSQYLVTSKGCGGFGLNLQHCHNIIYYSHDYDWLTRAQSEDRVHRIGQNRNVNIVDLCAGNTIDVRILDCLHKKENLSREFKSELKKRQNHESLKYYLNGGGIIDGKNLQRH